jgi:hypothetical protein
MLQRTALLLMLRHFVVTNGYQNGNWEVLTLCPWFETDLKVGFNCSMVPNVAKNMANLINIKQMYIYSLFCRAPRSFKGWVKFSRLAPMHGIDL